MVELDLLGRFSHVSDPPMSTVGLRDGFAEFREFLSLSFPAKCTSSGDGDQPIRRASTVPEEFSLSISPISEFPWRSRGVEQKETIRAIIPKENPQTNSSGENPSSLIFQFRDSWGSKRCRKGPIRKIRVSNRRNTISDEELRLKEEIAASGLLMLANQNPWKITKNLTESDLSNLSRLLIRKAEVREHIIPHMDEESRRKIHSKDGLILSVRDCDTGKVFELKFKWWNSSRSYVFHCGWRRNFVKRRGLNADDQIGLFWSIDDDMFVFSVLRQAEL